MNTYFIHEYKKLDALAPREVAVREDVVHTKPDGSAFLLRNQNLGYAEIAATRNRAAGAAAELLHVPSRVFEAIARGSHVTELVHAFELNAPVPANFEIAKAVVPKMVTYVLTVVLSPDLSQVVTLTKGKGPASLIGKITFPGGKIDDVECESPPEAATREIKEETGLDIRVDRWVRVAEKRGEGFELFCVAAIADNIGEAMTMEEEPILVSNVGKALFDCHSSKTADLYADDFSHLLSTAISRMATTMGPRRPRMG